MRVIRREFYNVSRSDVFRLVPLGDVHLGAAGCDEDLFYTTVEQVAADPACYWVGMGDYLDLINRSDKRFDPLCLASWLQVKHLADLPRAQVDRFLSLVKPIAGKCLGLIQGNHEYTIAARYERDVYSEIVTGIKEAGGFGADHSLALGFYGWLQLGFYWGPDRKGGSTILRVVCHHGSGSGKLEGGKALNLQRLLWIHDCDLCLVGHAHNTEVQAQDGARLGKSGQVEYTTKKGAYCGSFFGLPTGADPYNERKGFYHAPVGTIAVTLRPGATRQPDRVSITV